jgi:hypothetical protein
MNEIQNELLNIREKGLQDAEKIAKEMVQWIQFRTEEESRPYLEMKSVDVVLHRKLYAQGEESGVLVEQPPPEPKSESEDEAAKNQQQLSANDPLCVYFPVDGTEITEEVAYQIFEKALTSTKERLYKESKYLVNRLDQEQTALRSKIREYEMDQHQSRSNKQGIEHNNFITTKAFLISVLQKRIARFMDTAERRIKNMVQALKNHPKLSPFLGGDDTTDEEFQRAKNRIEDILKNKDRK